MIAEILGALQGPDWFSYWRGKGPPWSHYGSAGEFRDRRNVQLVEALVAALKGR